MATQQDSSREKFLKKNLLPGNNLAEKNSFDKKDSSSVSKEIDWTKTQDTYKNVVANIVFTTKWILEHCGKTLKHYEPGLTVEQYNLLRLLRRHYPNPSSINSLKENMLDKNSDVSRLVEKLRKKGWLERHDNERDRRIADVSLTKKGHELLSRLDIEDQRWPEILSAITEEEAEKLNEILGRVSNGANMMFKPITAIFLVLVNVTIIMAEAGGMPIERM